jgi:hypothetical protein
MISKLFLTANLVAGESEVVTYVQSSGRRGLGEGKPKDAKDSQEKESSRGRRSMYGGRLVQRNKHDQ